LLLLVVEGELFVLLLLLVILELDLESCLLLKGTDELRVDNDIGYIALLE
jgi:hypothetical protein